MTIALLNNRLRLHANSPRPPEDALWLAASIPTLPQGGRVLDAACGSGVAGLALLIRQSYLALTALDISPDLTALAANNAALNSLALTPATANILAYKPQQPFDAVLCNPPFHTQEQGHATPNPQKSQAHGLAHAAIQPWLTALLACTASAGTLHLITHTHWQPELETFAQKHTLALTLQPLQTAQTRPPKRLLAILARASNFTITALPAIPAYKPTLRHAILHEAQPLPTPA